MIISIKKFQSEKNPCQEEIDLNSVYFRRMLIPLLELHCRNNTATSDDHACLLEATMKVQVADDRTIEVSMPDNCGLAPCNFSRFALDPNDDFLAGVVALAVERGSGYVDRLKANFMIEIQISRYFSSCNSSLKVPDEDHRSIFRSKFKFRATFDHVTGESHFPGEMRTRRSVALESSEGADVSSKHSEELQFCKS